MTTLKETAEWLAEPTLQLSNVDISSSYDTNRKLVRSAAISTDKKYRYWLRRTWGDVADILTFIMLNPSTADGLIDDSTIRRCMDFGRAFGFGGIHVYNLFALRATQPSELIKAALPVGDQNDACLEYACRATKKIICAWGFPFSGNGQSITLLNGRIKRVKTILDQEKVKAFALGETSMRYPRHPLYLPKNSPMTPYKFNIEGML